MVLHPYFMRIVITIVGAVYLTSASLVWSSSTAAHAPCRVQSTTFEGWEAEEVSNDWVRLIIVPQLGGRLMQVTVGGHDYLFVNPKYKGKYFPPVEAAKHASGLTMAETSCGRFQKAAVTSSTGPDPSRIRWMTVNTNSASCHRDRHARYVLRGRPIRQRVCNIRGR
jgi:hypothetical protein